MSQPYRIEEIYNRCWGTTDIRIWEWKRAWVGSFRRGYKYVQIAAHICVDDPGKIMQRLREDFLDDGEFVYLTVPERKP